VTGAQAPTTNRLLAEALRLCELGFPVFPCFEIVRAPSGWDCACPPVHRSRDARGRCGSPGKHPRTSKGFQDASKDPATVRRWWMRWPKANIGIPTGAASGTVVLDIDPRNGGDAMLAELLQEHGELPETPHQLTGGGGSHYVFQRPAADYVTGRPIARGVDVKADGGYIIVAPSGHISGRRYGWELTAVVGELPLAPLPDWIAGQLQKVRQTFTPTPSGVTDGFLGAAFDVAGWLLRPLGPDKIAVRCPWESEHSSGTQGDSSTVVFAPPLGSKKGWFYCAHEHCRSRTQQEVVAALPKAAVTQAKKQLGLQPDYDPAHEDAPRRGRVFTEPTGTDEWKQSVQFRGNGRLSPTAGNLALFLVNDPPWQRTIEYDAFLDDVRWSREVPAMPGVPPPGIGETLTAEHVTYVQQWFARFKGLELSKDQVWDAIHLASQTNRVHPVRRYLDSLVWDGAGRLGNWLTRYCGAPDHGLVHRLGVRWMVSAIARVKQPGCQADHLLVLEGPQGLGKSQAVRTLGGPWYLGNLPTVTSKDAQQALSGHWIVEIAELEALRGIALTRVKDWITQTVDAFRPSYGRHLVRRPRQVVFIATTNESNYLSDETGNRRFWPIPVTAIDHPALEADRDQLWAEADASYEQGVRWWPEEWERGELQELQLSRMEEDPWENTIGAFVTLLDEVSIDQVLTGALNFAVGSLGTRERRRTANVLKRLGWEQTARHGTGRTWRRIGSSGAQRGLW
jgi:Virulence-associated protein E/Bifunctional DNA primase/polymerase, N-terminal